VLAQTFADFEVVAVNDGSKDKTGAILDGYAVRDARVRVIHKENAGVSAARNDGIKAARGGYLLFFDGDDFAKPCAVAELVCAMQEQGADVLIYGYHKWRDGKITQTCLPVFAEGLYEGGAIAPELISRFVGFSNEGINKWLRGEEGGLYVENPALWRCIVDARLVRENKLEFDTSLKIGEDTVFISDLLSCAERVHVTHKCYYYLVYRESSATATYEKDALKKLDGKTKLLAARNALTGRVLERTGVDIKGYWNGNTIMSDIELAFLFAKKGKKGGEMPFMQRYRAYLGYAGLNDVRGAARAFKPAAGGGVKRLPFLMLKRRWNFLLFICAAALNLLRYEFNRE